ncbi:hypothetical protein CDL12_14627 [Handroanthus impetiginosus]|uniref:Uncharacterized protein n=1 Tax=Handroanthus impetiginosus TaxID=429701 RepID=A0A2G9H5H3_9LAMI|nr:hypothetical protein CDL12_14627 [Handroanthus impetiginosus]
MGEPVPQSPIDIVIEPSINQQETRNVAKKPEPASASLLTRFHAGYFRISLSCWGQVLLWRTLSEHINQTHAIFPNRALPSIAFLLLWWLSLCTLVLLSSLYILRIIFHFQLEKAEFLHNVGVNYLFTPWISWFLLLQAMPLGRLNNVLCQILWWAFVIPAVILDIKTYGQWFTTEKRFLSMVANPTSQLSAMGNFVGAWAAARMGWKESSLCLFTLGLRHYMVVFITLYQRLSGANRFPPMLRPVFFLFVAAPSTASLAWSSVSGSYDMPCKLLFFSVLICRPTLFKKSMKRFNIAWWAYSFPVTFLALASAEYTKQVKGVVATGLMLILSGISVLVFLAMVVFTAINTDTLLQKNDPYLSFAATTDAK